MRMSMRTANRTSWPAFFILLLIGVHAAVIERPAALEALPRPSTAPFGIRVALGATAGSLTVTYSTTQSLQQSPCVKLCRVRGASATTPGSFAGQSPRHGGQPGVGSTPLLQVEELLDAEQHCDQLCGETRPFLEPSTNVTAHYVHVIDVAPSLLLDNGSGSGSSALLRYKCGSDADGWSEWQELLSGPPPLPGKASVNLLLFGDMGVAHALTLPDLLRDMMSGWSESDLTSAKPSAVLHVGDIAYDMDQLQGRKAQHFLRMVQPLSASLPYMVTPGNHEAKFNFSHYRGLYSMPEWRLTENLHYSYDVGPLHIASINTEVFFWPDSFGEEHMQRMYEWLEADLAKAHANRAEVPFLMVVGHRPMLCAVAVVNLPMPTPGTSSSHARCGAEQEAVRRGLPSTCPHNNPMACHPRRSKQDHDARNDNGRQPSWPLEELFKRFSVDIYVTGHIHCYVRFKPTYNYTVNDVDNSGAGIARIEPPPSGRGWYRRLFLELGNGPFDHSRTDLETHPQEILRNPKYPVHVISGAGGNTEMRIGPDPPPRGECNGAPWCAFQSGFGPNEHEGYDFSYSRIAVNRTTLHWQQYSSTFREVEDEFWLVKD